MNRDRKLIFLTVLYFAILGCFLLGCSEGTDSSPVSALMGEITAEELQGSASRISGLVLNSSTNEGIPNILVKILQEIGTETVEIKSDLTKNDGTFSISGFNNGTYKIDVKTTPNYAIESKTNNGYVEVKNGIAYPEKNYIYLKYSSSNASDTLRVPSLKCEVKHSDNSSINNAKATLYKTIPKQQEPEFFDEKTIPDTGIFYFFNLDTGYSYYIIVEDDAAPEGRKTTRFDFGIDENKEINPYPITIPVYVEPKDETVTLNIYVTSAYTGAPLELATVKINGENQGTTDKDGYLQVASFPLGICSFEITKEGFETLTNTKTFTATGTFDVPTFSMIEDTKDGYGSITGRFVDESDGSGKGGDYVRLYRLIERTQTANVGNKTETWYDVDRNYILTTKTSSKSGTTLGSFKLTHIEPGNYQIYITNDPDDIPAIEERPQIYNDFVWTQLATSSASIITQPLKVVGNQTTYWTNYEQGNN